MGGRCSGVGKGGRSDGWVVRVRRLERTHCERGRERHGSVAIDGGVCMGRTDRVSSMLREDRVRCIDRLPRTLGGSSRFL